ncbi:MAG: hypothetical protein HY811_03115 [Planctomycetes bacterium]|nr:hypothetical protein [Planctomycetota bacterium]
MGKFGECAIKAVDLILSKSIRNPEEAWKVAATDIFKNEVTTQDKVCPKNAFLGLCEEGKIKGVTCGNYTASENNKSYAIKAVQLLQLDTTLSRSQKELWARITNNSVKQNQQMDVVIALWDKKLIVIE